MSSVIKTFSAQRLRDGGTFNLEDLTARASTYLTDVRAQAASLLVKAGREAVEIRQRAEQDGRQAAQRAAEAQIDERIGKQMTSLLPALTEAVEGIVQARQTWLAHSETAMLKVATAIASRIARREVARQPDITLALIREALEMAAGSTQIQLRLNPTDHAALGGQVQTLVAELARVGGAEVIADETISPGGCRVDTRSGSIDQQFEAQLARIEEELS
ncbi:MAG TPA: FliH/SctL family protein [Pirellulales bacterium]|jgi:flagellar assembly protein FliH|nr:FliH/SctL family protein [Pirellulales bacterium]